MDNALYLTSEELSKLKEVGSGSDGIVYEYHSGYLIKIYRDNFHNNVHYYIKENGERKELPQEEALGKIIEKQQRIVKTRLPKKLVYVDGKFVGVLLEKVKGIQMHQLMGMPFSYRKKVMLEVIDAIKELLDNGVYHEDLSNSPFTMSAYQDPNSKKIKRGHSHVLLNPFTMKINIIDLDGRSTIYHDQIEKSEEEISLDSLTNLIFEFLFHIEEGEYDIDSYNPDNEYVRVTLMKHGIDEETATRIAAQGLKTIDEAYDVVTRAK